MEKLKKAPQFYLFLKRVFDFIVSLCLLVLFSPMLLVISLIIRFTSPGPAIFGQIRVGLNGRKFTFYKFRTMYRNADKIFHKELLKDLIEETAGPVFKIRMDARVTRIGRFLRKTSLDELPQLINVLKGDMSLVGPRAPIPFEVEHYNERQFKRLSVKPGITGLWQVSRERDLSFNEWIKMDIEYIDKWSILLDLKILFKTIIVVFKEAHTN